MKWFRRPKKDPSRNRPWSERPSAKSRIHKNLTHRRRLNKMARCSPLRRWRSGSRPSPSDGGRTSERYCGAIFSITWRRTVISWFSTIWGKLLSKANISGGVFSARREFGIFLSDGAETEFVRYETPACVVVHRNDFANVANSPNWKLAADDSFGLAFAHARSTYDDDGVSTACEVEWRRALRRRDVVQQRRLLGAGRRGQNAIASSVTMKKCLFRKKIKKIFQIFSILVCLRGNQSLALAGEDTVHFVLRDSSAARASRTKHSCSLSFAARVELTRKDFAATCPHPTDRSTRKITIDKCQRAISFDEVRSQTA